MLNEQELNFSKTIVLGLNFTYEFEVCCKRKEMNFRIGYFFLPQQQRFLIKSKWKRGGQGGKVGEGEHVEGEMKKHRW